MTACAWMDHGTKLFLATVNDLPDTEFAAPSLLPGWSRGHVIAHVHFNAEALRRLVYWARTGDRTPMYGSADQRATEIENGACLPAARLRTLVQASATGLIADLDALSAEAWSRSVVTAQGRTVPAAEIPWLRAREVLVHAVDLDSGVTFADLPEDFTAALAAEVVAKRRAGGEAAALASWLTGRTPEAPVLGPWL